MCGFFGFVLLIETVFMPDFFSMPFCFFFTPVYVGGHSVCQSEIIAQILGGIL